MSIWLSLSVGMIEADINVYIDVLNESKLLWL